MILHGSRSGVVWTLRDEFNSTRGYARSGAAGLGWNATVGEGALSVHMKATEWGWNAREHSDQYGAVEIANARLGDPVTDGEVRSVAAYLVDRFLPYHPHLGKTLVDRVRACELPEHWELPAGVRDGKTDVVYRHGGELAARVRTASLELVQVRVDQGRVTV